MREEQTDILIVGGGLGGVAASLAALRLNKKVILTEETDWLGGQLTVQAVPPDEHPYIEKMGCTASYRSFRNKIREYYRQNYPLTEAARSNPQLNPGMGFVSGLCHEPWAAQAVLEELLAPYKANGQLKILLRHRAVEAERDGDRVLAVTFLDIETNEKIVINSAYILDATELGDLLPMAGVEFVTGAESQAQTGEPHALTGEAQPLDQQSFTWCFALTYQPGEDHTIPRPAKYEFWRNYQAPFMVAPIFNWTHTNPFTLQPRTWNLFEGPREAELIYDWWHYRRIFYRQHYLPGPGPGPGPGHYTSDVTVVNWPQNDYWLGPLVGVTEEEKQKHLEGARQLSLSLLYWMQTEAPRLDGGIGYSGLQLAPEILGTPDGFAKQPYIRESRRIKAEFTVYEQHLGVVARGNLKGAEQFPDSVGIGSYRIDLHPSTGLRDYIDISNYPFQIPLGALLPERVVNLLPAAKNLGVTHITNGCYRLHPVEWNIGEAAGALAAYCLTNHLLPRQVRNNPEQLAGFRHVLQNHLGFELVWPEKVRQISN